MTRLSPPKSALGGHRIRKPSPKLSQRTRKRLEGFKEIGVTLARKNPVVDNIATGKELAESTYKVVKCEDPPSISSELKKLPGHIRRAEKSR